MNDRFLDDDNWWTMCEALQTHAGLYYGYFSLHMHCHPEQEIRTQAIADMLNTNAILAAFCKTTQMDGTQKPRI
jgi:hypothetical protein